MAHPSKFVSVNLNRSYGQPNRSSSSSSPGVGNGRARPGAAGGGGMVVLSRPRSSGSAGQKGPLKLSVPPPLNLPSLRKEHERSDSTSVLGASGRPGSSGLGSGSGSSTTGWTKPGLPPLFQDRDGSAGGPASPGRSGHQQVGYMPPAARVIGQPLPHSFPSAAVEKAVFLRGEDFPSLRATISLGLKQKDTFSQKQKQPGEGAPYGRSERPELQSPLDMRPQMRSSCLISSSVPERDEGSNRQPGAREQFRKQDGYLPGPLPVIRLSHTSDWADDERDTVLTVPERDRDCRFSRTEVDFSNGRGARDVEGGCLPSKEFLRGDSFRSDFTAPGKDGRDSISWRTPQPRDWFSFRETRDDRDRDGAKAFGVSRETSKESNYAHLPRVEHARDGFSNGAQDNWYTRRDLSSETSIQNGRNLAGTFNGRAADRNMRGRYGDPSNNQYRGDAFQNSTIARGPFSTGSKGFSLNDPILKFGREKRLISNNGKPYLEDAGLDSGGPFSGELIGEVNVKVFKKKKDMQKQADFHDLARESFEAEIERVQRMQELERQQIVEQQAKVLELARKEQEEGERLAREEVERRRRLEEEAREAAWRADQERLDAVKRTEEQKIAREEEKRMILMEEERRKEAARKKLLELEERIAKRQAEANLKADRLPSAVGEQPLPESAKERNFLKHADIGEWEDGERMVERIPSMTSSDSSNMKRVFDAGSKPHSSRDGNSSFVEKGQHANSWRRGTYDNGNSSMFFSHEQENDHHNLRSDPSNFGRVFSRKEIHGNLGTSVGLSSKDRTSEPSPVSDDLPHSRGNRWNVGGDGDSFSRNSESNPHFLDNDKFGDAVLGPGRSRGSPHAPYAERSYQNSEVDEFPSFGRSRYSLRQPRVLPPPSMFSTHKSSFRAATQHPDSSPFLESEMRYQHVGKAEETIYDREYEEMLQRPKTTTLLAENTIPSAQNEAMKSRRCDSQSSLSVSSPPTSPTHLSNDDLDESEDPQALPTSAVREQTVLSDNEHNVSALEVGNTNIIETSSTVGHGEDDEWATENHGTMPEQEEYDDDDNGYQEEEEGQEINGENLVPALEFEDIQSDVLDTSQVDQMVLGFDEGVEVKIPMNDEFEETSRTTDMTAGVEAAFVGAAQELTSSDGPRLEAVNASPEETRNDSFGIINETEKVLQELVLDPVVSTSYTSDSVEATSGSGLAAKQLVSSALSSPMPSTSPVQPILSSVYNASRQPEAPIKLQFGLFSGPSLIPSPVQAIQVGSIQMPLHPHPHVGPSITQLHSSQSPLFQFGQLRYTSPISQGILPLAPQAVSFVQPPASAHYSLNQNLGGSVDASQESSSLNVSEDKVTPSELPMDKQPGLVTKPFDLSHVAIECRPRNALPGPPRNDVASQSQTRSSIFGEVRSRYASASQAVHCGVRDVTLKSNYRLVPNNRESHLHVEQNSSHFFSKASGMVSGSRGKSASTVRSASSRSSLSGPEISQTDLNDFQRRPRRITRRTEFRVREIAERRQSEAVQSFNYAGQDGKPNLDVRLSGNSARFGVRKVAVLCNSAKMMIESENSNSGAHCLRMVISDGNIDKVSGKDDISSKKRMSSLENSHTGEVNMKSKGSSEADVDAPRQSGVVQVFKQPGIEAPSDEDDFIQVRSKRQMLNDRREKREKELKANSRVIKEPRRRVVPKSNGVTSNSNREVASMIGDSQNNVHCISVNVDGKGFAGLEASPVFTASVASQGLPPIGTPALNVGSDTVSTNLKPSQTSNVSAISSGRTKFIKGLSFGTKNGVYDNTSMPLGSWGNVDINQQVMALTQSQLDEAMQAARFDSHAASSIGHEPNPSSSNMIQEKSFSSSANSLNSLLAGEKIQFGAVTSPTILPPLSRAISNVIGSPGSGSSDVCTVFFDKEKRPNESCAHLEDPEAEAEAEAAASAVAVAAISSNDEIIGNMLGACSVSVSDPKSFSVSDATMLTSGGLTVSQEVTGRSKAEESPTVALRADLLVEPPSLPLWHPLPSPQSTSGPMFSQFPATPPTHFPCFEMTPPMLGGPIFAFGPHDESAGNQTQPHRSTTLGSGQLGPWPQCHSTVDSIYGPPAGFTCPFIGPPGGIPGVQVPPHMVVYNHFTPVGQFGQVGLSFMGTTYIPTGNQLDWKHNSVSSAVGLGEGGINNLHVSAHHSSPSMPARIQHMAPGSPIMPMASPLSMFDMSPFQSSADISLQAHWSHMHAPPIHSVPLSMPFQQHQVNGMPAQYMHSLPVDTSAGNNRFNDHPCSSTASDGNHVLPVSKDDASRSPDGLGLVEPASSTQCVPTSRHARGNDMKVSKSSVSSARKTGENTSEAGGIGTTSSNNGGPTMGPSLKPHAPHQPTSSGQQYLHPIGYSDQRGGGASQKTGSGGEWQRRMGYQGRNRTWGPDKNLASSKVKKVYVAKSPTRGTVATG